MSEADGQVHQCTSEVRGYVQTIQHRLGNSEQIVSCRGFPNLPSLFGERVAVRGLLTAAENQRLPESTMALRAQGLWRCAPKTRRWPRRWGPRPRGEAPLPSHPVWAEGPGPGGRSNLGKS